MGKVFNKAMLVDVNFFGFKKRSPELSAITHTLARSIRALLIAKIIAGGLSFLANKSQIFLPG